VASIVTGAPSGPALEASGLAVRRGAREVVSGIEMSLRRGEVTVLLGPNGAGKSTLLNALAGLVPISAGNVNLRGRLASASQVPALARRSVRANVELAMAWWGVPRGSRRAGAMEALGALGVGDLAERHALSLSGGEARRVHLARVLSVRPDVLLLDEPFAGLDANARADLLYDIASVLRAEDRATCIVVHDRSEAWALADRVLVLLGGRIVASGSPAQALDRPPTVEVARFLGFSGEINEQRSTLLLRPGQVVLDPGGAIEAQVRRRIPIEDGVRLELALDRGRVFAYSPLPGPDPGTKVRLQVVGGVRFRGDLGTAA
jgi:ABC-type sulfate/molybdate transport systems ATPase subunit